MKSNSILVVDDVEAVRVTLQRRILALGYTCDVASSVEEAIEMLSKDSYQLAILDMRLRDYDVHDTGGMTILKWLASTNSNTKAIICTGYASLDALRESIAYGEVVDYLMKGSGFLIELSDRISEFMAQYK